MATSRQIQEQTDRFVASLIEAAKTKVWAERMNEGASPLDAELAAQEHVKDVKDIL